MTIRVYAFTAPTKHHADGPVPGSWFAALSNSCAVCAAHDIVAGIQNRIPHIGVMTEVVRKLERFLYTLLLKVLQTVTQFMKITQVANVATS